MRIILWILGSLAFLLVLLTAIMTIAQRLSDPADPASAKRKGDVLVDQEGTRVLAVVAHPDDVDWYTGGTLAALRRAGNHVTVIVATSGEKGGDGPGLAARREAEQRRAAAILGYDEVIFFRLPDRGLRPDTVFKNKLREVFLRVRPSIVFTFDPELEGYIYRHSDHRAAGFAAVEVAAESPSVKKLYLFHSRRPNVMVNIAEYTILKTEALKAHASQRSNRFRTVALFIPRALTRGFSSGFSRSFPKVGVEAAELFREAEPGKTHSR